LTPLASKFWETASSGVAQKWLDRLLSPSLIFWVGVASAYSHSFDVSLVDRFSALTQSTQALVVVQALFLVSATAAAVELASFRTLRYLEGYWPPWLDVLRRPMVSKVRSHVERTEVRWKELKVRFPELDAEETLEFVALDRDRGRYPRDKHLLMPTRLGNVMRASETYAQRRYGLAAALLWPRMWLHVDDDVREQIRQAQALLMGRVRVVLLASAFNFFSLWAWWVPVVGLSSMLLAYRSLLDAAVPFGHLQRAVFDLHHRSLVSEITGRQPEGEHPMARATGEAVTMFLRRGERSPMHITGGADDPK
jgi:hypothetical protein